MGAGCALYVCFKPRTQSHSHCASYPPSTQIFHIPTDLVVAQEASAVESSSRLDFLLLDNLRRRFIN